MKTSRAVRLALLFGLLGVGGLIAFEAGGFAYTKRVETVLYSQPHSDTPVSGRLGFKRKVKVDEVRGPWLRVSDGPASGWVYFGNMSLTPIAEVKGSDGLPLTASQTTASAAARPLTPEANAYAVRKSYGQARVDLDWLQAQDKTIQEPDVVAYLRAQKRGEYQ